MASSQSGAGSPFTPHPVSLPQFESLNAAARYCSAGCGGDFFDAVAVDGRLAFLLMDIAGRQPETQAIAVEVQKVFRARAKELFRHADANESEAIATLARNINLSLLEAAGGARLAPAFLGCYNLTLHILTYHYAGRLLALFHDAEKTSALEPGGMPLGLFTHSTYEPAVLAFGQYAKLLLVTKGATEDGAGATAYDDARIALLLNDPTIHSASKICEAALEAVDDFEQRKSRVHGLFHPRNHKQCDDLTAVALVRRGEIFRS